MIREIEDEIIERLLPLVSSLSVQIKNAPANAPVIRPKAIALVLYTGSSYEPPTTNVSIKERVDNKAVQYELKQNRTFRFAVILRLVDMQNQREVYPIIEGISDKLNGFIITSIPNCDTLYLTGDDFVSFEGGSEWEYRMDFQVSQFNR